MGKGKKHRTSEGEELLKDFPEGPLDPYRKQASFDWKTMALVIEREDALRFKHHVWKTLENDPMFAHSPSKRTLEEERKVILQQAFKVLDYDFLHEKNGEIGDPAMLIALSVALGQYDWSLSTRRSVLMDFFTNAVRGLAKTGYHFDVLEQAYKLQITGCVALTEISHGTNTKAFRTRATYDPIRQQFIIHTPDFEAAKCWAANMGKTATHAFLMCQLYTPDGQCQGLHGFVVPIRDPKTLLPFPGVSIFDMGEKLGLNGLDNGVMMFDNYPISRECLLNKNGSVTEDGSYVSKIKDPSKRFGAALGNLSAARCAIIPFCVANMVNALTISIRYSAVRRQFGGETGEELPVIEYQMQQWRLFPYLAATYVWKFVGDALYADFVNFVISSFNPEISPEVMSNMGTEIHVLSSSGKPIAGWLARDSIQESREACGGHGYLRCAGIGQLRDNNDANVTYEGDNNVLLQQTSNHLINVWSNPKRDELISKMPLNTLSFLTIMPEFQNMKFFPRSTEELKNPSVLLRSYKWLVCYLLQSTAEKFSSGQQSGKDAFMAKNDSQIYAARTLSIAFIEHYSLEKFWEKLCLSENLPSEEIRSVLKNLMLLYGYWSLEKHLASMYQGGFAEGPNAATLIREVILELCLEVKPESISLIDAIAPTDFVLNSALGKSDGNVYKNLQQAMMATPKGFERDSYWKDIATKLQSNL